MSVNEADIQTMRGWIFGYQISKAIFAATKLGIADILESEPHSVDKLSKKLNCHSKSLYRLLRALTSIGIFQETEAGVFAQNDLSSLLTINNANSLNAATLFYCGKQYQAWGDLTYSIQTGKDSFSRLHQKDFFSYMHDDPSYLNLFNQHLNNNSVQKIEAVLSSYDFSQAKKIIDLGGGNGHWLIYLLEKYAHIHGVVFDTVAQSAAFGTGETTNEQNKNAKLKKLGDRICFITGNFLESVPTGGDLYFLSNIIHQWNDENAMAILKNCRKAIDKNGKLLLVEHILPGTENKPDYGKWMDISMLVMLNGREREKTEYESLLQSAKFKLTNVIPTLVGLDIIEAIPI